VDRDIQLNRELVDQIVFGMENQDHVFYLDLETRTVVPEPAGVTETESAGATGRFVRLPQWRSADGYNLMSKFVATLRNPIYRERLRGILASGRGVFRQFKDAVGEREDIERLWHAFKQREMRHIVAGWVNDLRELWGLERLELDENEATDELVAADFVFGDGGERGADTVRRLDRVAFAENHAGLSEPMVDLLYEYRRAALPDPGGPESEVLLAETPAREIVGFLWAVVLSGDGVTASVVAQLYVLPEYRGIGIARSLLRTYLVRCHDRRYTNVIVELVGSGCELEDELSDLGLSRSGATMAARLDKWARENGGR
jgi:GNAT superfamily N-acetyltransferase